MRFSEVANGAAVQSVAEVRRIQEGWGIVEMLLKECGLDEKRLVDAVIMDWVKYYWASHFERQLEARDLEASEIALLFLRLLADTFEDNFNERMELFEKTIFGRFRKMYHLRSVHSREAAIVENIRQMLFLSNFAQLAI